MPLFWNADSDMDYYNDVRGPDESEWRASQPHRTTTSGVAGLWRARCSCGWQGEQFDTVRDAERDALDHVVACER